MEFDFSGELWFWRGPAPWHFVSAPADTCDALSMISPRVSYGWGMIPVTAQVGTTEWTTALFPKDGKYYLPLKDAIRKAESLQEGTTITATLHIAL